MGTFSIRWARSPDAPRPFIEAIKCFAFRTLHAGEAHKGYVCCRSLARYFNRVFQRKTPHRRSISTGRWHNILPIYLIILRLLTRWRPACVEYYTGVCFLSVTPASRPVCIMDESGAAMRLLTIASREGFEEGKGRTVVFEQM